MDTSSTLLLTLTSSITTLAFLMQSPAFTWISALPYMLPLLIPLFTHGPSFTKYFRWPSQKSSLNFTSRLRMRLWYDEPNSLVRCFSTVLWDWNRRNKTVNCQQLMEEGVHHYYEEALRESTPPFFVDDANQRFWHVDSPNIHYTMWVVRETDRDGIAQPEIFLRIEFKDPAANPNTVVAHIDLIMQEAKRVRLEQTRVQRVLVSSEGDGDRDKPVKGPSLMAYEFHTTSSFDNFFCEEAEIVRADLRQFLENKATYVRTGRPWTYTVLNEGPPGVGKTKLVKAIAALTGYTLIVINLSHIQNTQMLYEAFHTTTLAGETVPHNKRLYYIPEVDIQLSDVLKARAPKVPIVAVAPSEKDKGKDTVTSTVDNKPTLGEILNVLDGIPERHGHILVLDTNHLATLDPALIRPGRVDRILSWKKLSATSVRRFLENYYETTIPMTFPFSDRTFTAAELQSRALSHATLEDFLSASESKARTLETE